MADHNSDIPGKKKRPAAALIVLNLLIMIVVAALLGWLVMSWLGFWTNHGKTVVVPQVKGLTYVEAMSKLEDEGMVCELNDSVYDAKAAPGAVLEQNPKAGNHVKPGRTVYLTVNAFYPRKVTLPSLSDISLRQATSTLEGLGISRIEIKRVPSEYLDLVLSATADGKPLTAGQRIPVNSSVVLTVGDGMVQLDNDSTEEASTLSDDDIDRMIQNL